MLLYSLLHFFFFSNYQLEKSISNIVVNGTCILSCFYNRPDHPLINWSWFKYTMEHFSDRPRFMSLQDRAVTKIVTVYYRQRRTFSKLAENEMGLESNFTPKGSFGD